MIDFVFDNQTSKTLLTEEFFVSLIEPALKALNLSQKKVELGLHLIKPERSQELNLKYRQKDKPTDVLSFPLEDKTLEKYDIMPLGDIFICIEVAERQAEESGIPLRQELARLTVHGLLHLVGYDHEKSPEEENQMTDLEEKILASIGNY